MKQIGGAELLAERSRILKGEGQDSLQITYRLLQGAKRQGTISFCGIEVRNLDTQEGFVCEDLTSDLGAALSLFDAVYRGGVTPLTARDVVEDWLAERDTIRV